LLSFFSVPISADVIYRSICPHIRQELEGILASNQPTDFAFRIIQVAKYPARGRTNLHTGRLLSFFQSIHAEGALLDNAFIPSEFINIIGNRSIGKIEFFLIDIGACFIGTRRDAGFTPDALVIVYQNQAILVSICGARRTHRLTERVFTMITLNRDEQPCSSGILTGFLLQHLAPEDSGLCAMRCLACHCTGITAYAKLQIYQHAVSSFHIAASLYIFTLAQVSICPERVSILLKSNGINEFMFIPLPLAMGCPFDQCPPIPNVPTTWG
jgi:hypothetical protein